VTVRISPLDLRNFPEPAIVIQQLGNKRLSDGRRGVSPPYIRLMLNFSHLSCLIL
jgi:hypothetical protein